MAGVKLNEASLEKKLYHAEPTQQGIQALTKWITGHKDHYQKIVELWRKILKKSQPKHRLTLFYVANDVIQYARRKKVNDLYTILKNAIRDVVPLLREDSILPNVQRVLTVWLDREIFEEEYVQELRDSLDKQKLQAAQNAKIVERFKPTEMTDKIKEMMKREDDNEKKLKMLKLVKVDVSSPEAIQQIKDRMHGTKHCNDFEDACSKLEDYVTSLAEQIQMQKDVGDRLVQSQVYYEHQYGEAKIVANAYKNFSLRVNNLRKRLAEFIKILPDPEEPEPEALSPEYDAPSPGNTPPPDLTKDHIMDEHMDVSDGEEQEPNLVFENEKSSPFEPESGAGGGSDGEESNSSFDVDALLEKEFDNSPQATPSQKRKKRYTISMEPQSPPPTPRPQHPAVASFMNTSYKTESTRSSSANSSPGRNTDGASSRNPPSALDQRLAALTAKGGETMMSLFGGMKEARDDDDEVHSNGSQGESSMKSPPKSGEKRPYASSPERNGGDRTPTRDEAQFERASKTMRTSSPVASKAGAPPQKGPHTPVGPHTPSGSEPHTPTTSSEYGTPVRVPFFPPGAPVPPTPPPSIAILNPGIQAATIGTPPPKKPQPPIFKSLKNDSVPPLPPPPPFPTFFNLNTHASTSNGSSAGASSSAPVSASLHLKQQQPPQSPATPQQPRQIPSTHHSPAAPHSAPLSAPVTPHSISLAAAAATSLLATSTLAGLALSQPPPPIPIAPLGLVLSLSTPIIPLTSIPVSGVAMSGVGAAVPGVVETPSANFDKSDQVLFKAQDEFLRRLKEKSAKGSKPPPVKISALAGMTMTLPPKPTKSPPPSFPSTSAPLTPNSTKSPLDLLSSKEEKQPTADVDLRLGNVDLKKLSKDIDAIMKKESSKKESEEELLKKDYQPELPKSPDAKSEDVQIQDVDMRRDKSKPDSRETKKKRLSIVRPPPSVVSKPSSSTSIIDESSESRRRPSSSASTEEKRKFEGESCDGASARGEGHSSRSESRDASTEKESVWRRLSAETFSQRESKDAKPIAKEEVRRYSEMCDNYYRTYYEEQYGTSGKEKKHSSGGSQASGHASHSDGNHSSGSSGGRRNEDTPRYDEDRHPQRGGDHARDHHHGGGDHQHGERYYGDDGEDRRSSAKRKQR